MKARRVDAGPLAEMKRRQALQMIEEERRRRKCRVDATPIAAPKGRHAGRVDITDIPTDEPWQHRVLNDLGQLWPRGKPWTCPRCGHVYMTAFPPMRCRICKEPSPIAKVNWRQ